MSDMNSMTDSFSWNLENLLIPEDINDLFIYSQEGSAQKPSLEVDSVTQSESVVESQQEQQQQFTPPQENSTASFDQITADICNSVDVEMAVTPQKEEHSSVKKKADDPLHQSATPSTSSSTPSSSSSSCDHRSYAEKYLDRRQRNNMASRKSREKRKNKNHNVLLEIEELSLKNESLKSKVKTLEENLEKVKALLFASVVVKKTD